VTPPPLEKEGIEKKKGKEKGSAELPTPYFGTSQGEKEKRGGKGFVAPPPSA